MNNRMKRVALAHDLSGYGRCSLTAAIPILSAMGLKCCPLPTAVLSAQTGFHSYSFLDLTPCLPEYLRCWREIGARFDGVYTGFLGSEAQVDILADFISGQKGPDTFILVDPVFGDNGRLYPVFTKSMPVRMRRLVGCADIVVPNLTEAAFLSDYGGDPLSASADEIARMAAVISSYGPKRVVVTGCLQGDFIANYGFDFESGERFEVKSSYNHQSYGGTGDVFASVVCGCIARGDSMLASVQRASAFVEKAVKYTERNNSNPNEGVLFETFLKEL